jgi:hypothetical protein
MPAIAAAAGDIIKSIGNVAISAHDSNKRRQFDFAVTSMSQSQQTELAQQIAAQQTQAAKVQVLMDAIQKQQDRKNLTMYAAAGVAVIVIGIAVFIAVKNR